MKNEEQIPYAVAKCKILDILGFLTSCVEKDLLGDVKAGVYIKKMKKLDECLTVVIRGEEQNA